ncbi:hypothetical protein EMIHUDRAFT_453020 [Emiliania huxleyi CCMP1516]|uniref:Phospholipid scramblase n=2 Tax=Emiliania huxleyi TaxID=2903 RepID=A0A0D3IBA8_EMIH1|nr:hypothetical protein EMIHUDRAFT_453020 [Emiliania huxleyi CCMP1516]EOD08543.1 hypothetical protein EMIHUDRAFT_453020 [Emiliania huxleyi CCMP1516]|eukprot:XP_005760972.1 hypothetical protein EMIHUDRAFT_453020 [Emiliania huxleyi CCMP1516]
MAKVQLMDRSDTETLGQYESLFVKQTKKGCVQECFGCEATNEFKIYPSAADAKGAETYYSLEESDFCMRFCCKNNRAFTQTVWTGTKESHSGTVMTMSKEFSLSAGACLCCCNPAITFKDGAGDSLGGASLPCYVCLPKISVFDPAGQEEYKVQMPSCVGGMCIDCCAEGLCNCKVPFYIYPAGSSGGKGEEIGKIVKMWRGLGTEVFTDADSFQLDFPKGIDASAKARMLGTTAFVNMIFFEEVGHYES